VVQAREDHSPLKQPLDQPKESTDDHHPTPQELPPGKRRDPRGSRALKEPRAADFKERRRTEADWDKWEAEHDGLIPWHRRAGYDPVTNPMPPSEYRPQRKAGKA
jgi:hypothetical protein